MNFDLFSSVTLLAGVVICLIHPGLVPWLVGYCAFLCMVICLRHDPDA